MHIHKTAIIEEGAKLADDVQVGPYAFVGRDVEIKKGTSVGIHAVIEGYTTIGQDCEIFSGAVIGSIPQDLKYKGKKSFLIIGNKNIIREYVTINPGTEEGSTTSIGNENLFMAYSHVAHDCKIGDSNIIANVGTLAGYVTIEDRVVVGGLAAIHQFVRLGRLSIVGGCSKVVQDIPPFSTCDGHPARVYGLNLVGLKRAKVSQEVLLNLKRAFKILFNSGMTMSNALKRLKKEISVSEELSHLINFVESSERGVCRGIR